MPKKLFLIMPRASDPDFLEKIAIAKEEAEAAGMTLLLPEYDAKNPSFSRLEYHAEIDAADVVVADLSFERPSCYFELGFAEGLNKKIIRIALKNTIIHQTSDKDLVYNYSNIKDYRVIMKEIIRSI